MWRVGKGRNTFKKVEVHIFYCTVKLCWEFVVVFGSVVTFTLL